MAHAYSTDSTERRYIPFFLAATAIAASFLISDLMKRFLIELPWWAISPDTMACYGLFYFLFERYCWKWRVLHYLGVVKIIDLSGIWRGTVLPLQVNGGPGAPTEITISIRQTWTTLLVKARTAHSKSESVSASFTTEDEPVLTYEYSNEPSPTAPQTMHAHRGLTRLILNSSTNALEGDYYSGRDRQNIGSIQVIKEKA